MVDDRKTRRIPPAWPPGPDAIGRWVPTCALLIAMVPGTAWAHKLNVFAVVEGDQIRGEAYYRGRVPVRGATVKVLGPAGQELGQAKTDDDGKFTFVPKVRCDHKLVLDSGDGHIEEYAVTAAELPAGLAPLEGSPPMPLPPVAPNPPPPAPSAATDQAALASQIAQLRREVDDLKNRTQLRDILGGIGYILGLTGLAFYFLGARRRSS